MGAVLLALLPPTLLPMASAASLVGERARARARMVRAKERAVRAREKAKEKGGAWTLRRSVSWQIFLPLGGGLGGAALGSALGSLGGGALGGLFNQSPAGQT